MEVVELRVHGVHGTSPGAMLGVSDAEAGQVAGDRLTGIYRAKDGKLPYRNLSDTRISVEAYSWGALTSGVQGLLGWVKRALWLLLLPFALVNLSYWARLTVGERSGKARWGARAVRASSLLHTVFIVLTPCVIAIDMVGWQCYRYGVRGCTHLPTQLNGIAAWTPTQRIALATVVPMLLIGLLWLLSRQTLIRYEETPTNPLGAAPRLARTPLLRDRHLWQGNARTLRLQRLHLTAAIATVIVFSGRHTLSVTHDGRQWLIFSTTAGAVLGGLSMALVCVNHRTDLEHKEPQLNRGRSLWWAVLYAFESAGWSAGQVIRRRAPKAGWLTVAALAVYVVHVVALRSYGGQVDQTQQFYGHNLWFIAVFVLLTALHLTLFAGGRMHTVTAVCLVAGVCVAAVWAERLWSQGRFEEGTLTVAITTVITFCVFLTIWQLFFAGNKDTAWRGAGSSVLLATAAWIALLFTSSAVVAAADYLNGPDHSVGDLVTVLPEAAAPEGNSFLATGDIVLRDANVIVDDLGVKVFRGTVTADGLSYELPESGRVNELSEALGSTPVLRNSTLALPTESVSFQDSCVLAFANEAARQRGIGTTGWIDQPCTAENDWFLAGGVIQASDLQLLLQPRADIVLENTHTPQAPLAVPQVLVWTPIGQLVWLVAVLVLVIGCVVAYGRTAGRRVGSFLLPGLVMALPDVDVPESDRANCRKKRRTAALAHRAEALLGVVGAVTSPIALLIIVYSFTGQAPWELAEWTRRFATLSMYAVLAMSVGLVALGSQIRRSESARKAVGVIWDLTTFWPRAAHPLAPPCYAERVVPELETRARWALEKQSGLGPPENRVILSGHSQGSLIVVAMASRLSDDDLARVRIITYGSQIRALYGRVFPRVFGPDDVGYEPTVRTAALIDPFPDVPRPIGTVPGPGEAPPHSLRGRLEANGGRWVNLFRRSDPLGYRVFSDIDSDLDVPVPEVPRKPVGDPGPIVMTHSGYQHTMDYRRTVCDWTPERLVPDPPGTGNLPTLPPF